MIIVEMFQIFIHKLPLEIFFDRFLQNIVLMCYLCRNNHN